MQVVKALPFKRTSLNKGSDKLKWHFDAFYIFLEAPKTQHQLRVVNFTLVWWWKQMSRSQRFTQSKPQPSKRDERKQLLKKSLCGTGFYCTHHTSPQNVFMFFDNVCIFTLKVLYVFTCFHIYIPSAFFRPIHPILWSCDGRSPLVLVWKAYRGHAAGFLQNLWVLESFLLLYSSQL